MNGGDDRFDRLSSRLRGLGAILATTSPALFMVVAKWFGPDRMDELIAAKTGQILATRVEVPHAGWP